MPHHSLSPLIKLRYLPLWMLMGLLRLCAYLPYPWLIGLGKGMGCLLYYLPIEIKKTAKINLALCFPQLSKRDQQSLLKKNFMALGAGIMETAFAWFSPIAKLTNLGHIQGLEHLQRALKKGKGVILISPHLTSLQIAGRLLAQHQPFAVVYRPQKNPVLNYVTQARLKKQYYQIIPRHDLRTMLRSLANNKIIWYTPDVDAGLRNSIFVPFLGVEAATITTTARLAKRSGAAVIPAFFYRRDDGSGYDLVGNPPMENFPSEDLRHDTQRINEVLSEGILKKPEQYIWQYKRFKTRPKGEPRFYGKT